MFRTSTWPAAGSASSTSTRRKSSWVGHPTGRDTRWISRAPTVTTQTPRRRRAPARFVGRTVVVRSRTGRPMPRGDGGQLRDGLGRPVLRAGHPARWSPPSACRRGRWRRRCSIRRVPSTPSFTQRGLDVVDAAVQQDPRHGVHGEVVAQRRARAGDARQVDRRVGVHERQRHELGETAGLVLDPAPAAAGGRPSGAGGRRGRTSSSSVDRIPSRCAVVTTSIHCAVGSLPLVSTQRTSSSRISAAVPGMRVEAGLPGLEQQVLDRQPGAGGAVDDLHRRERVHVHLGHPPLHRARRDRSTPSPGSSGSIPPCMQTSVAPSVPGLGGAVGDLVERQRVGVGVGTPLREGAEAAADVADVREVDVPVDDVRHVVADRLRRRSSASRATSSRPAPSARHQRQGVLVGRPPGSLAACAQRLAADVRVVRGRGIR